MLFGRCDRVGRISKFPSDICREEAVLLIVIGQHFPVVKSISFHDDNFPSDHTQLLRVEPERVLLEHLKTVLRIEEERQRDRLSPLDQCRALDFGWLFGGNHMSICLENDLLIAIFRYF